jgi:hypothetical protein
MFLPFDFTDLSGINGKPKNKEKKMPLLVVLVVIGDPTPKLLH